MKRHITLMAAAALALAAATTSCTGLGGAVNPGLGGQTGSNVAGMLGGLLESVFTQTNLNVQDLAGQWTVDGSAVAFKSENLLAQAGGAAAATAIENKLNPYFNKYGLTGAVFTISSDGTFTLQSKALTLGGNITKQKNGNFSFNFTAMGLIQIGSMETYVQKSGQSMEILFDAKSLTKILSAASAMSSNNLAGTVTQLLGNYDGIYVGFHTTHTGNVTGSQSEGNGSSLLEQMLGVGKR